MTTQVLNTLLAIVFAVTIAVILFSAYRARRADYRDIDASEINPDLAAGQELLRDALDEARHSKSAGGPSAQ